MEPIPPTAAALEEIARHGHPYLAQALDDLATRIQAIVPECVALSVGLLRHRITFTVAATDAIASGLDAVQYLDGGPCVTAAHETGPRSWKDTDPLDHQQWTMFTRATTCAGIASTLSFPIVGHTRSGTRAVGTLNMYAATTDAFDPHHDELAEICGTYAWAAVVDSDLAFATRIEAAEALQRVQDQYLFDEALDVLMTKRQIDRSSAVEVLHQAAARADITDAAAARALLGVAEPG